MFGFLNRAARDAKAAPDLADLLAAAERGQAEAQAALDALERRAGEAALGDAASFARFRGEKLAAADAVEQAGLRVAELQRRLEAARRAEAAAELEEQIAAARLALERNVQIVAGYGQKAAVLAEQLGEFERNARVILAVNRALDEAGRPDDRIAESPVALAWPDATLERADATPDAFLRAIRLPGPNGWLWLRRG